MTIISTTEEGDGNRTKLRSGRWSLRKALLIGFIVSGILQLNSILLGHHPLPSVSTHSTSYLVGYYMAPWLLVPSLFLLVALIHNACTKALRYALG